MSTARTPFPLLLALLLALAGAIAAAVAGSSAGERPTPEPGLAPRTQSPTSCTSCKPQAPLDVELVPGVLAADGTVEVRYRLAARIDALELSAAVSLPYGGAIVAQGLPEPGFVARGGVREGWVLARLPAGGGEVVIDGLIALADDEMPGGFGRFATRASARWGEFEPKTNVVAAFGGSEPSLDVPSIARAGRASGADSTGEGR